MVKNTKKTMPDDTQSALAALEKIVYAEEEMRTQGEGGNTPSQIFLKTVVEEQSNTKEVIASQLAGSAVLHMQSENVSRKKLLEEQVQELSVRRLHGLCEDAATLGRAFAFTGDSSDDKVTRENVLSALRDLQLKLSQTHGLACVVNGKNPTDESNLLRNSSSALTSSFLCEVAAYDSEAASELVKEYAEMLVSSDLQVVSGMLLRGESEEAHSFLSQQVTADEPVERAKELSSLCAKSSPENLNIAEESFSLLKEKIDVELIQINEINVMLSGVRRKSIAKNISSLLRSGRFVEAVGAVFDFNDFSEEERLQLLRVIRQGKWVTKPQQYIEALTFGVECECVAEPYSLFPSEALAPYDALALHELFEEYSPARQLENERLLDLVKKYDATRIRSNDGRESQRKKQTTRQDSGKMSELRYAVYSVILARKEGRSVLKVLHDVEKVLFA